MKIQPRHYALDTCKSIRTAPTCLDMNIVHYLQALLDLSSMARFSKALVVKCILVFLSLIYIIQDRESQIQTQSDRVKKPKSQKKKTPQSGSTDIDSIHNQSITNFSLVRTNMKTTSPQGISTVSVNLRFSDQITNILYLLGFEGKDESKYL